MTVSRHDGIEGSGGQTLKHLEKLAVGGVAGAQVPWVIVAGAFAADVDNGDDQIGSVGSQVLRGGQGLRNQASKSQRGDVDRIGRLWRGGGDQSQDSDFQALSLDDRRSVIAEPLRTLPSARVIDIRRQ